MLRPFVKSALLRTHVGNLVYGRAQQEWFEHTYRRRRERYQQLVASDPQAYSQEAHLARARAKIARRGYVPSRRRRGEVHTFAYLPSNWPHQTQIATGLAPLGPVSRYDYAADGIALDSIRTCHSGYVENRARVFERLLQAMRRAHLERPLDWFFSYSLGWDMTSELIVRIQEEFGIPTVNISLDDKNWWEFIERGDVESGLGRFAPRYDLAWTSARSVVPWYWAEGGQAMFLPEGVNSDWFAPVDVEQDIQVGFVGNCFGHRARIVEDLRKAGIVVRVHGKAWPFSTEALSDEEMRVFFSRCRINLGLGDMHFSRWMTNLKGRDFEVPSTGRGLYLTTYNADLASCFSIGKEIQCYRGIDELIELIRHHLSEPEVSKEMARQARRRCLAEHQWLHRYQSILTQLGILDADTLSL
jgi:hypothetical protein